MALEHFFGIDIKGFGDVAGTDGLARILHGLENLFSVTAIMDLREAALPPVFFRNNS